MESSEDADLSVRRYLLGNLSPDEREWVEKRLLSDERYLEILSLGEDELIEEYCDDSLTEAEREKFRSHFLAAPERRNKLRFARAFRRYTAARRGGGKPAARGVANRFSPIAFFREHGQAALLAAAVTALPLMVAGGLLLSGYWRLQNESALLRESLQTRTGSAEVSVSLAPGILRGGGETTRVELPPGALVVNLRLEIGLVESSSYRATLNAADGSEILVQNFLQATSGDGARFVDFPIPARSLRAGDYYVGLTGSQDGEESEALGRYSFRVVVP